MTDRILWNRRGEDIDEIVLNDVATVHVEQISPRCWWIGIILNNGNSWDGNFLTDGSGRMRFLEQESNVDWDDDRSHEATE